MSKPFKYFSLEDCRYRRTVNAVENPSTDSQVFIEVQIRERDMYRTKSGILIENLINHSEAEKPPVDEMLGRALFQINFDDLFSSDVYLHCDIRPIFLSLNIDNNVLLQLRFSKFFKRVTTWLCNKIAKYESENKSKGVMILINICAINLHVGVDDIEAEKAFKWVVTMNQYSTQYTTYSIFDDIVTWKFNDHDDYYEEGDEEGNISIKSCGICFEDFEKGIDAVGTYCEHTFHTKCIIPWFNIANSCPLCRCMLMPFFYVPSERKYVGYLVKNTSD